MSGPQLDVLRALGPRSMSTAEVAARLGVRPASAGKSLAALFRRSLVSVSSSGRWYVTDRGRRKQAAA